MLYLWDKFVVGDLLLTLIGHIASHKACDRKRDKSCDQDDQKLVFWKFAVAVILSIVAVLRLLTLLVIHKRSFSCFLFRR